MVISPSSVVLSITSTVVLSMGDTVESMMTVLPSCLDLLGTAEERETAHTARATRKRVLAESMLFPLFVRGGQ